MNLVQLHPLSLSPANSHPPPFPSQILLSNFSSRFIAARYSFRSFCSSKGKAADDAVSEEFSVLSSDIPWDGGSSWSTMALYFFSLHIPLSFGGLSLVTQLLHQPILDPQMKAISLPIIQTTELLGALALLQYTTKRQYKLTSFFHGKKHSGERNWIQASALGFGFLISLVLLTSLLADRLIGTKDVNNPMLTEILSSSNAAKVACFTVYCFITPLLEEIVYRGFLLTSLTSTMEWWRAVIISACVFSAAHLSWENAPQLFIIGCVLGCTYCWTGNLASSFTIHSLYNAVILLSMILA
ncbi:uncharacterized protein LOC131231251 [Magnolia sinica]|uniref:uncharacterized protein LOC131231251 n=1 Tax=Magnolia sinica TaxID=86752 RepID=UPI00265B2883|nr:uncharacterized protein LOC131231251 [Magnolia sinica]